MLTLSVLSAVCVLSGVKCGGGPIFTQEADGSGKVGYTPPDLSDENTHSSFLPDRLRCEGCKAVAYQMFGAFRRTDRKRPSLKGVFAESLIYKITGEICDDKDSFEKYGLKIINDQQELIGPGMGIAEDAPGAKQQGGMWPPRLRDICNEFIDNLGDLELYRRYRIYNNLQDYTRYLCYNTGVRGLCQGQTGYQLPEQVRKEDIYHFKHQMDDDEEEEEYEDEDEGDVQDDRMVADDEYVENYDSDDDEEKNRLKREADVKDDGSTEKSAKYTLNPTPPPLPKTEDVLKQTRLKEELAH